MKQEEYGTLANIKASWRPRLREKIGAPTLLGGLDVYYDFDWHSVIGHNRAAFRKGKNLAQQVKDGCPSDKIPCLLLTTRDDVEKGPLPTDDDNYVVVAQIQDYRRYTSANPALSYFAGKSGLNTVTAARRARKRVADDRELDDILASTITAERLVRWGVRNAKRIRILESALATIKASGQYDDYDTSSFREEAREDNLLPALKHIMQAAEEGLIERIANELTSTPRGREAASGALSDRLSVRIRDLRDTAREFRKLLSEPGVKERDLQKYIEKKPLLLGLGCARVLPAQSIPRGKVDFMVRRHDGRHDLLELKSRDNQIVRYLGGNPKRPSSYSLSAELAQALAQVHLYREWLAITPDSAMNDLFNLRRARNPRVMIVIGLKSLLPTKEAGTILDQLNLTLHRMEVMPYDMLARRAEIESRNLAVFA